MNPTGKKLVKQANPKPCPTCYRPMTATKTGWTCDRHGVPVKP